MSNTTITPRQLRALLFDITDQTLTVNELRHVLFGDAEQETMYTPSDMARHINDLEKASRIGGHRIIRNPDLS